jgi:hypothetical protein
MWNIIAGILTAILGASFLAPIIMRGGNAGFAVTGLISIGLVWTLTLWKGVPIGLKVPMIIVLAILCLVTVLGSAVGIITPLADGWDRPKNEAPVLLESSPSQGTIAVVYHPGGSDFTKKVVMSLGKTLQTRGYSVSIFTADPELSLDRGEYKAVVLCSPVYGGKIRPPLQELVSRSSPLALPVYAVITGWMGGFEKDDLARLSEIVVTAGGSLKNGIKIATKTSPQAMEERLTAFVDDMDKALKGTPQ